MVGRRATAQSQASCDGGARTTCFLPLVPGVWVEGCPRVVRIKVCGHRPLPPAVTVLASLRLLLLPLLLASLLWWLGPPALVWSLLGLLLLPKLSLIVLICLSLVLLMANVILHHTSLQRLGVDHSEVVAIRINVLDWLTLLIHGRDRRWRWRARENRTIR